MDEIQVMMVIQLKSASDALVTKMIHAAYRYICRGRANEPEATARQEDIVRGIRKIRRTVLVQIDRDYGLKFKADNELAVKRLDELRDSMTENNGKFREALNRIDEMNESFREERKELFKDVEQEFDEIIEEINEDECVGNVSGIEVNHNQVSNLSRELETSNMNECYRQSNGNRKYITSSRRNSLSKNRLRATNTKLEEILKVSSTLVGELSKLNHHVGHLAEVSERMADMQYELGIGRKMLSEVEADRNDMKRKLVTLERLIKEEEKYLDEFSYESGFEENEMPVSL